jgi:cell division protein FtsQ
MFKKIKVKRHFKIIAGIAILIGIIGFVENRSSEKICEDVQVSIKSTEGVYFIDREDVINMLTSRGKTPVVGGKLIHIDLRSIENRLKSNNFVDEVEVSRDHKGNLLVYIEQAEPIARVMHSDSSYYLSKKGKFLPLSMQYTARVPLVRGVGVDSCFTKGRCTTKRDSSLFKLFSYVHNNSFLDKLITEYDVHADGTVDIYTVLRKPVIHFGEAREFDQKFKKVNVLYEEILNRKGWNTYSEVNVSFKNQIICK